MRDFHTDFAMFLSNCTKLRQGIPLFTMSCCSQRSEENKISSDCFRGEETTAQSVQFCNFLNTHGENLTKLACSLSCNESISIKFLRYRSHPQSKPNQHQLLSNIEGQRSLRKLDHYRIVNVFIKYRHLFLAIQIDTKNS